MFKPKKNFNSLVRCCGKLFRFFLVTSSLVLTVSAPKGHGAETVRSYERKNGTIVQSYSRHSPSSAAGSSSPTASDSSYPDVMPQYGSQSELPVQVQVFTTAPPSNIATATPPTTQLQNKAYATTLPVLWDVSSQVSSTTWEDASLVVHGTLTNTSTHSLILTNPILAGYDTNKQIVNVGEMILSESVLVPKQSVTFNAQISDPQRAVKFTKISGHVSDYNAPKPQATPSVYSTPTKNRSDPALIGGIAGFLILSAVGFGIVTILKGGVFSSGTASNSPSNEPTTIEIGNQQEALADLRKGITPSNYSLAGYLCKKNEKVIFSFQNVRHFHQGTHSHWTGRSAGVSVRIAKGLWFRTGANKGHSVQSSSMDNQGKGCLVFTNQAFSFIGLNTTRIPFSRIACFEPLSDGFSLDTDYARNNKHFFVNIHPTSAAFVKDALELISKK